MNNVTGYVGSTSQIDKTQQDIHFGGNAPTLGLLIDHIAKSLVDNPQQVLVKTLDSDHTTILELRVAKEDVGKVIGKQGRTAQAMRTLLSAVSSKARKRMVLEIIE